jgi:hypothetical protein
MEGFKMIPGQMERKVVDLESEVRSLMQRIDKLEKMISGDPFTESELPAAIRAFAWYAASMCSSRAATLKLQRHKAR